MKKHFFLLPLIAVVLGLFLTGCSPSSNIEETNGRLVVLVSVAPYKTIVEQIGGNTVFAKTAVPSDLDPHNWEPTYKDMGRLKGAKVWFTIGEHFEHKLSKKLKDIDPNILILNLSDHVTLLDDPYACQGEGHHSSHTECHGDTHFWLDPLLDIQQATFIANTLSKVNPKYSDLYETNLKALTKKLEALNQKVTKSTKPYHGMAILTTHGAYTYYCNQYGLKQIVLEPSGGKEVRTHDLSDSVYLAKKNRSKIIGVFIQPQHTNKSTMALAKELDLPEYEVNPYEANYIETIERITNIICYKYTEEGSSS